MYVIRHGQSVFNAAFNKTGRDPGIIDAPLTGRGFKQARLAADSLKQKDIRKIISSPYTRALQTAQAIAGILNLGIEVEPLLGERSLYSCDIGTPRSALKKLWPRMNFARLENEEWWPRLQETDADIEQRVHAFKALFDESGQGRQTLIVSHWYFIFTLTGGLDAENAQILFHDSESKWHKWPA
jgi:broad specificity phosphatase PhoE